MSSSAAKWIISKIAGHHKIKSATLDENEIINITREGGGLLKVAVISHEKVTDSEIQEIVMGDLSVDFVVNIPKDAYTSGSVLSSLEYREIGYGGVGDLYSVINQDRNWPYTNKEVSFILRGLSQHTKVNAVQRLDSRRYEITRYGLPSVIILALNDYDLSTESVRHGKSIYRDFQAILTSNPNVRVSDQARTTAEDMDINIYKWGELLGMLNRKW